MPMLLKVLPTKGAAACWTCGWGGRSKAEGAVTTRQCWGPARELHLCSLARREQRAVHDVVSALTVCQAGGLACE